MKNPLGGAVRFRGSHAISLCLVSHIASVSSITELLLFNGLHRLRWVSLPVPTVPAARPTPACPPTMRLNRPGVALKPRIERFWEVEPV